MNTDIGKRPGYVLAVELDEGAALCVLVLRAHVQIIARPRPAAVWPGGGHKLQYDPGLERLPPAMRPARERAEAPAARRREVARELHLLAVDGVILRRGCRASAPASECAAGRDGC